ncbi:acetyl-CoA synthetase-like protein [Meira miltonrushii]|uniref:Acetyl-CoA synthetase-like protein n=1 Tax=Meira miltonrushii TaxID=1280837 RepID=A0A316VJC6_9BASI|nr:acetyl-CoA synthetase-like protein [Meira miltonrushii]PWN37722.1 acetyl-CoA synthetase-like protein [Meira miltonrushii]
MDVKMKIYQSSTPMPQVPNKGIYDLLFADTSFDDGQIVFKECFGDHKEISRGQLKLQLHRFGLGLQQKKGLKKGDVVLAILPNMIGFPIAVFGCVFAGLIVAFANPAYSEKELKHIANLVEPKAIATVKPLLKQITNAGLSIESCIIMDQPYGQGSTFVDDLLASESDARKAKAVTVNDLNETAYLPCSSGTTGLPKAVMISHRNMVSMLVTLVSIPHFYDKPWRAVAVAPFFHAMALANAVHLPLFKKGSYVAIMQRFDAGEFCDVVKNEKIDFANLAPPALRVLMAHPKVKQLNRIELMCVGAAPLDAELQQRAMDVFGCEIAQGHGMTETTVGTLGMQKKRKLGSCGPPMPGLELRVVDDDGNDVKQGERGELLVRAGNIFRGYWKNEAATKETFTDDGQWLKTGDIAVVHDTGDFSIVDRKKELIKYKGYQVAPAELEGLLLQHPKVAAAAVIGIYDKELVTELPRAYIQLKPDHKQEGQSNVEQLAKDLTEFIAKQTSSHKRLRGGVRILEQVPVNPSGKILRKEIRALAAKEENEKSPLQAKL